MAEGARLESVYTATYRGFESLPHRQTVNPNLDGWGFSFASVTCWFYWCFVHTSPPVTLSGGPERWYKMAIMPNPKKDPKTGVYKIRQVIPPALRPFVEGKGELKRSLDTKDPQEA